MKKYFITGMLIILLIMPGCSKKNDVQNDTAIPVSIYKTRPDTIASYIKLTGSVTGKNDAIVYSKISEKLESLFVKAGQNVSAGQIMAVQYNAVFKQAVDLASAAVKTAKAQFDLAESDYARMEELYKQKALSPQQYDQIKAQRKSAAAGFEQANLQYDQANENYQNSFIKAPFDGMVGAIFFEKDQMIPAGQPVIQVVTPEAMKSKLQVSGKDIASVKLGQNVIISFPAVPGKNYLGRIENLNKVMDPISNLLEIEVRLLNPDSRLKSGMFGEFEIETENKKGIIAVPENSLMQRTEISINKQTGIQNAVKKYFVYAVVNGSAKLKEVKTGIKSDGRIEVTGGLNNADSVIVVGQNIVRDGQKVKIVE